MRASGHDSVSSDPWDEAVLRRRRRGTGSSNSIGLSPALGSPASGGAVGSEESSGRARGTPWWRDRESCRPHSDNSHVCSLFSLFPFAFLVPRALVDVSFILQIPCLETPPPCPRKPRLRGLKPRRSRRMSIPLKMYLFTLRSGTGIGQSTT